MREYLANADRLDACWNKHQKPPPKMTGSQWADSRYVMSTENSASPGPWKCIPYQTEILDACTDVTVEKVSVQKSARLGYTQGMGATIGFYMEYDPCSIMIVQPTVEGGKIYSKEFIAPMLRDVPALAKLTIEDVEEATGPKDSANTMLHKRFPGGVLSIVGANSGAGFRSVSRRVVIFDEVDAYPPSAGSDGDQIALGTRRTEAFWNRKIIAGSTPLLAGASRIERMYLEGDQRRYFVPCPHCQHMDFLVFSKRDSGGHWMHFDRACPEEAHFVCSSCDEAIEHKDKEKIVAAGEWRASKPFKGHASFHIWAAYSPNSNASWGQIATEFLAAKQNPETLRTFVNTTLGEVWRESGEAPDWERLYARREHYEIGTVPNGVVGLTAGVDVQKDSFRYEITGWGANKESWSIDSGVIPVTDTSNEAEWTKLDELLSRTYRKGETVYTVRMLAVDSGFNTQMVYNWARRYVGRVIAVKGSSTAKELLGTPTSVDVTVRGTRFKRGCKVWSVGVDVAKQELYGWLRLPVPLPDAEQVYPAGFCHFPMYGPDFFKELTAEHLVSTKNKRTGFTDHEWQLIPGRVGNHFLDARVYSRAAAACLGLDRLKREVSAETAPIVRSQPAKAADPTRKQPKEGGWLSKGGQGIRNQGRSWLKR